MSEESKEPEEEFEPLGPKRVDGVESAYEEWQTGSESAGTSGPVLDELPDPKDKKPQREVPRDTTFDDMAEGPEANMREALANMDGVNPTESDKSLYLKSMLNDEPIQLSVSLCGGNIAILIRARTAWEQTCIHAAISKDYDDKLVTDMPSILLQMQRYGAALMIVEFGSAPFEHVKLDPEVPLDDCVAKLREARTKLVDPMSLTKWTLALNALRVFESKISTMGSECLNENFWTPADSSST